MPSEANCTVETRIRQDCKQVKLALWKLDRNILPPLTLIWLANYIDRTNVGNARIAGLEHDLHLKGNQFNIALSLFFISYLLVDIPSNLVLIRIKPNRWLPFLVCTWGLTTILTFLVQNFAGLAAVRFCLGLSEGGLLPCMILYLSTMYNRYDLQLRVGIFYASASISGAFGGLLSTAIIKMDGIGDLAGWRWIFILEGIVTILVGLMAAYMLPAEIASSSFLTEEEKIILARRLLEDRGKHHHPSPYNIASPGQSSQNVHEEELEEIEMREIRRGLSDIQTWLTGVACFCLIVTLYSYGLFLPTIITDLGYSGGQAQLHTVPPYVPAAFLTVIIALLSDRLKMRGPLILLLIPVAIAGFIMIIVAKTSRVRYIAVFLIAAGAFPCTPGLLSILPNNTSGHYKRATAIGLQLALANCGGFVATFVYTADQRPRYIRGHCTALAFLCLAWISTAANVLYCLWENQARSKGRRQSNIVNYLRLRDAGLTRAPIGDRHPDFRFTL